MVAERYLNAVSRFAAVDTVLIPALAEEQNTDRILDRLDGFLLTGSPSNIEPHRYGSDVSGEGPFDPGRDAMAMRLIAGSIERERPLLAICRGFQEVNVALGGSLISGLAAPGRDLSHHAPDEADLAAMFEFRHPIALTPGGVLSQIAGQTRIEVNSAHYQGIDRLGSDLAIEARSEDGLIEAVRLDSIRAKLLAVQWHPEWRTEANPVSRAIYALFGAMVRGASLSEAVEQARPVP